MKKKIFSQQMLIIKLCGGSGTSSKIESLPKSGNVLKRTYYFFPLNQVNLYTEDPSLGKKI